MLSAFGPGKLFFFWIFNPWNTTLQLAFSQVIGIFKLITENTEMALEDVMNVDMISSMQMLATCITRISDPSTDRIKIKYCGICESVCSRMDSFTLRKESPARYIIIDILLQWMSARVCFPIFTFEIPLTYNRRQGRPRITILIWHVFERSSSCWIVCNFVHSILPILEMMSYITFHDFSINIRRRCFHALKPVSLK